MSCPPSDRIAATLLKPLDVAQYLGIGRNHAYHLMRSGRFRTLRLGQRRFVRRATLERWLAAQDRRPQRRRVTP